MGEEENMVKKRVIVEQKYCNDEEIELTVHKKSMFRQGDGFTVYDPNGDIIFRVDYYGLLKQRGLLLMDSIGQPLLTLLPKRPTLHRRLEAFLGETWDDQEPIFGIWKSTIIGRSKIIVEVYHKTTSMEEYHIEGSFKDRNCTISRVEQGNKSSEQVALIKLKVEATREMVLGTDVFSLVVKAGTDAAFTMGLVLALDAMDGDHAPPSTPLRHLYSSRGGL